MEDRPQKDLGKEEIDSDPLNNFSPEMLMEIIKNGIFDYENLRLTSHLFKDVSDDVFSNQYAKLMGGNTTVSFTQAMQLKKGLEIALNNYLEERKQNLALEHPGQSTNTARAVLGNLLSHNTHGPAYVALLVMSGVNIIPSAWSDIGKINIENAKVMFRSDEVKKAFLKDPGWLQDLAKTSPGHATLVLLHFGKELNKTKEGQELTALISYYSGEDKAQPR